jgi:hypothetical protein
MPTNRTRIRRLREPEISEGEWWWLEHGRPLGARQAEALGCFEDPTTAAWHASNLHFVRGGKARQMRAQLREMGFSARIEAHIANGAPPDDWRG